MLTISQAARLLKEDPRGFGATVKRLYLSGQAGGAELRELLALTESMEAGRADFYPLHSKRAGGLQAGARLKGASRGD